MWSILGPVLGAGAGVGLWELLLKPVPAIPKSEVVQFTQTESLVDRNSKDLTTAMIEHDVNTDGSNYWIMVKPADRTAAVQVVRQVLKK